MHKILQKCKIWKYRNPASGFEQRLNMFFSSGNKVKAAGAELQMGMMMMRMVVAAVMIMRMVVVIMVVVEDNDGDDSFNDDME